METILVVDDEEMIKDLARDILARYGYTVLTAGGGEEAVEVYRRHTKEIAVVVLDIVMPDVDGREVFRRVREINPAAQVIIGGRKKGSWEGRKVRGRQKKRVRR